MRFVHCCAVTAALALVPSVVTAQDQDASRVVKDGGISVPGWQGKIDPQEVKAGQVLNNARLAPAANGALQVTTGPAVTYWNPKNVATGNYTVKATFTEANYMGLNDHPHPYGIVIAGNDMGTDNQSYLYCSAYGDGSFIVRGFGPAAFQMGGRRPTPHDAVNKAAGKGSSVTQEIAVSVDADSVDCAINGKVVASYPKSDLVAEGKLKATDGVYGLRFAHNTDAVVTGLSVTRQ
ncbi:MAG TPA: hypothetical protein VMO26_05055 [Vicinamibacterales bacterium]|nr:hypothetical protein [Vicinamibacterales bacterium]